MIKRILLHLCLFLCLVFFALQFPYIQNNFIKTIIKVVNSNNYKIKIDSFVYKYSLGFPFCINLEDTKITYDNYNICFNTFNFDCKNFLKPQCNANIKLENLSINCSFKFDDNKIITNAKGYFKFKEDKINLNINGSITSYNIELNTKITTDNLTKPVLCCAKIDLFTDKQKILLNIKQAYKNSIVIECINFSKVKKINLKSLIDINCIEDIKLKYFIKNKIKGNINGAINVSKCNYFDLKKDFKTFLNNHIDCNLKSDFYLNNQFIPINLNIVSNNNQKTIKIDINKGIIENLECNASLDVNLSNDDCFFAKLYLDCNNLEILKINNLAYSFKNGITQQYNFKTNLYNLHLNKLYISNNFKDFLIDVNLKNINLKTISNVIENEALKISGFAECNIKNINNDIKIAIKSNNLNFANCALMANADSKTLIKLNNLKKITIDSISTIMSVNAKKTNVKIKYEYFNNHKKHALAIKGLTDLSLLPEIFKLNDRYEGSINLDLNCALNESKLISKGSIKLENGVYELDKQGTFFQDISMNAIINDEKIIIKSLTANDIRRSKDQNTGKLNASGEIELSDLSNIKVNIDLILKKLRVVQSDVLICDASGMLKIKNIEHINKIGCIGNVDIINSNYFIEENRSEKVLAINQVYAKNSLEKNKIYQKSSDNEKNDLKSKSEVFPLFINLNIENLKLTGMGIKSYWKGSIDVVDSIVNPQLIGSISLKKGSLIVLDNKLKLTKGLVEFVNEKRNDPKIDIVAQNKIDNNITIYIVISGFSSDVKIDLDSKPLLSKDEILSLAVFGKHLDNVSILQAIQLASVVNSIKNGGGAISTIKNALGIDSIDFETENKTTDDQDSTKKTQAIKLSKNFGKFHFSVEQGAGSESSKVSVSTPLNDHLMLEGSVGNNKEAGIGINWIKRY